MKVKKNGKRSYPPIRRTVSHPSVRLNLLSKYDSEEHVLNLKRKERGLTLIFKIGSVPSMQISQQLIYSLGMPSV